MPDANFLMRSETELLAAAGQAIDHARKLGISEASALANEASGITVRTRDGEIVSSVRDGHQSLSVTVFDGRRSGHANVTLLTPDVICTAVERAVAIAREVQPDPDAGLPEPDWLALDGPDVAMFEAAAIDAAVLTDTARRMELAVHATASRPGVVLRVDGAGASAHEMRWARATTQGFARAASATEYGHGCTVIADSADGMAMRGWSDSGRQYEALALAEAVGTRAAVDAEAAAGARGLSTRTAAVMLDSRIAGSLIGELTGALNGMAQWQGTTFLPDALGTRMLAPHLDLIEDAFEPYGLASSAWDSDGVASPRRHVVQGGVAEGYFLDTLSARKLGMTPTGNADGINNLTLTSRETCLTDDKAGMLHRLGTGLLITGFIGGGLDRTTGAWSKAATGFWVEGGEIAFPVHDLTVAGELPAMLKSIRAVGIDVHRAGAIRCGSILLDTLTISGR